MVKVGIPRSLLYYQYFPMWKTFFQELGAEVVVSEPTSRPMLMNGSSRVVAETCLPVKVFCGHVISLVGRCDYLFVPAVRSLDRGAYNCSKFLGLPDLVKAVVPECPPILDIDIDLSKGKRSLYASIYRLGRRFAWSPLKVKRAAEAAWLVHQDYLETMRARHLTPPQAIASMSGGGAETAPDNQSAGPSLDVTIALIGHPYVIYDEYINHRLVRRLRSMGVTVFVPESVPQEDLNRNITELVGRRYWTYEDEVVGAGGYYLHNLVDGVISVVPFGCGPDSLMIDLLQRHAKRSRAKPFMSLAIDEHTAEAGLVTRLEAFLDMLTRRKRQSLCA